MRLGLPAQTGDKPGNAYDQPGRNAQPVAAFQGRAMGVRLLDDFCAAKHCGKHDRRHPDTIVGVNVGAMLMQQIHIPSPIIHRMQAEGQNTACLARSERLPRA
jgi:hypothetical protein